jgi:hypothetical protein
MTFDADTGKFETLPYGERPNAHAAIVLNCLDPGDLGNEFGETLTLAEHEFDGDTEEQVKAAVVQWVSDQRAQIIGLVWGHLKEVTANEKRGL